MAWPTTAYVQQPGSWTGASSLRPDVKLLAGVRAVADSNTVQGGGTSTPTSGQLHPR